MMANLPAISPLLLMLTALAFLFLALSARLVARRKAQEDASRLQQIVERGSSSGQEATTETTPMVFRDTGGGGLWRRIFVIAGYNPDITRVGGLPSAVVLLAGVVVGAVVFLFLAGRLGVFVPGMLGGVAAMLVTNLIFRAQRRSWQRRLFEQIPDSMGMITRAIRAGLPLTDAMESVARDMPEPTRSEFGRVLGDVAIGRGVDQALLQLRDRSGLPEYGFLAVTLTLQSRTGGSLAETLENLGDLVRKRVAMAAKVKSLTAEARVSAVILFALPLVAFGAMALLRPDHARFFIDNPTGVNLAIFAAVMSTLGMIIIRTMIRRTMED